jgi:hypothetical protein
MSEVIQTYTTRLSDSAGRVYGVQASGRQRDDGSWEGWLEFLPIDGAPSVISPRETTQPNRDDLAYWATGLTDPYLDGALIRALREAPRPAAPPPATPQAEHAAPRTPPPATAGRAPVAILDPFQVYAEGDEILRGQLRALSAAQLRNIILAHGIGGHDASELERMSEHQLIPIIMRAAEERAAG